MRLNLCITVFLIGTISGWRNHSGIRLNIKPTQASSAYGNRGRSSIQIGKGFGLKDMTTTIMSTTVEEVTTYVTKPQVRNHRNAFNLTIGIVVPFKTFGTREYTKALTNAINALKKKDHEKQFKMNFRIDMLNLTPSPIPWINNYATTTSNINEEILSSLCKIFLPMNVSSILYLMNYEKYGRSTASAQYFLQLAGYLGIPVIAWNADNSGLERRASQSNLQLQLAPSLEHQTAAMLSILERYKWHQFSVVTSQIAGHDDFIQAVREKITEMQDRFKFTLLNAVLVTKPTDLLELKNSESRVMLLYATSDEANLILKYANDYNITGENYVWVVTQSVIEKMRTLHQFPIGMLGVHFDTNSLVNEISTAIKVFAYGVESYINDPKNANESLNTQLSCEGDGESRWKNGERFYKYLRNVSLEGDQNKPRLEFTADGVLKAAELKIMNLRRGDNKQLVWEEIGVWKSWEKEGLDIKDIVWPGNSHTPPQGVPEKFHLKITFLEEPPYISLTPPDPVTGKCNMNRGVQCRIAKDADMEQVDILQAQRNASFFQCCSGFCIDLLQKFAEELGFTFELFRVEDGRWGTFQNGKWNGLIADLVNRKTDMVMTALMINSDREAVVDFSVPFMETGTAILVAKRTGIISPTAFLEPFDTASWFLVGVVAIHAATFTIFLFEWLSPSGFNMKTKLPSPTYRFSILRSYWLVWAVLFQAAVHVDCPRGLTSRFMTNIWAMFAVVFLAIYTANLAAFMITREEFHEFTGIDDPRLQKPLSHKPPIRFGTVPFSHTDSTLSKYFKEMHTYMSQYNKSSVREGVDAVLSRELDSFIYDGTVLDYLVEQDEACRLLTVGTWYAKTGYGLAFARNSKYLNMFNQRLLDFRENGDLERLRRYWMTGSCKPGKHQHKSSDPLAMEQFLSAFVLLMFGILIAFALLGFESGYFKYARKRMYRKKKKPCCCGCCRLISVSMGKVLESEFEEFQTQSRQANSVGCKNKGCVYYVKELERYLDKSQLRIQYLEMELDRHGVKIQPYPFFKDVRKRHDMTRIKSTTEYLGNFHGTPRKNRTEIAEIETVL